MNVKCENIVDKAQIHDASLYFNCLIVYFDFFCSLNAAKNKVNVLLALLLLMTIKNYEFNVKKRHNRNDITYAMINKTKLVYYI